MTLPDIPVNVPVLVTGAFALLAWCGTLISFRNLAKTKHATDRLRSDREFVTWAQWTSVGVVADNGRLYYRSLYELQDEPEDLIWDNPRALIIFRAGPDNPDPYNFGAERGDDGRPG